MIRELAVAGSRLVLKGGMAMRVVVGSLRLTKDVDFDRAGGASTTAIVASLRKGMQAGSQSARLLGARVDELKAPATTVRMRLTGSVSGSPVRFSVEVSGRDQVATSDPAVCSMVEVVPPMRYGLAPFKMACYTPDMLAASKVAAVMSPNRNVPRDVSDLHDLAGAYPSALLQAMFDRATLEQWRSEIMDKVMGISYDRAHAELVPYIPPRNRDALDRDAWEDMLLSVGQQVERWLYLALGAHARPS